MIIIKKCNKCRNIISTLDYFESERTGIVFCKYCGNALLVEHLEFDKNTYVLEKDYKITYADDEVSDIELYKKKELDREEIEEAIEYFASKYSNATAYINGLCQALEDVSKERDYYRAQSVNKYSESLVGRDE